MLWIKVFSSYFNFKISKGNAGQINIFAGSMLSLTDSCSSLALFMPTLDERVVLKDALSTGMLRKQG